MGKEESELFNVQLGLMQGYVMSQWIFLPLQGGNNERVEWKSDRKKLCFKN